MSAKDIELRAVTAKEANECVKRLHYSGKVVANSQLHIGVFYKGRLEGAMQFGPSLDKRKVLGLVKGTPWNGCIELNRLALSDRLPRNSESRAISVAMRMIRKYAPHVQWVISFADGAQCGDGAIYRASGFVLTGIKKNTQIWEADTGERFARISLTDPTSKTVQATATRIARVKPLSDRHASNAGGGASMRQYVEAGFKPVPGFQLRYMYFLDPEAQSRLTVPILPFSVIDEAGAGMYRGHPCKRPKDHDPGTTGEVGGETPTRTLQSTDEDTP